MKPVPYFIYAPVAFLLGVMIGVVALNINCPDCPPCEDNFVFSFPPNGYSWPADTTIIPFDTCGIYRIDRDGVIRPIVCEEEK